jgi:hypothetical protein
MTPTEEDTETTTGGAPTLEDIKSKKQQEKDAKKAGEKELTENERLKAKLFELQNKETKYLKEIEYLKKPKKEPGITNIDEDNREKKKRPNSWGLHDMLMPPYVRGRVAIYRICSQEENNPATGLKVEPVDVLIPGKYVIHDRFEQDPLKRAKVIKNVTGTETELKDGKPITVEKIDDIIFQRGWLHVPIADKYPLHVVMELHPNNKNNKFRPNNAPVLFERVDIDVKSASSLNAALDLALDAGTEVRKMEREDVLAYAAAVKETIATAGRPFHEIKGDLQRWAMNNPLLYFKLNKNSKAAVQVNIIDAINFGLVEYMANRKGYVDMETDETICVHTASEEPMDKLVKYLSHDERGKKWYANIMERMNYFG